VEKEAVTAAEWIEAYRRACLELIETWHLEDDRHPAPEDWGL
jgi:hypothetical protein